MYPLNGEYATNEKDGRQSQGKLGNDVSLADGPDGKANGSYQFHGTDESYIEFPNDASTLGAQHSITMLCWVYISSSAIFPSPLFVYYSKKNSNKTITKYFGMAIIKNATLAAYFRGTASPNIQSGKLELNHWHYVGASYDRTRKKASLWVNGAAFEKNGVDTIWTLGTGYSAVRMGAFRKQNMTFKFQGRIAAMQVYDVSLTKEQIEAVRNISGRGKNISYKASVCKRA